MLDYLRMTDEFGGIRAIVGWFPIIFWVNLAGKYN